MLGVSVKKMMAPTVKMEKVTLTGKGRWNLTCYMYSICNSKIFFFSRCCIPEGQS